MFAPTYKNKEILTQYTKLWNKIKNQFKTISDMPGEYKKKLMKIKFDSDDNLPLNKILKLPILLIVVRSVFLRRQ